MGKEYKVNNLHEALNLAKEFKKSGKYNLFRGQAQNWNVVTSAGRLPKKNQEESTKKVERLIYFFEKTPSLRKYLKNADWFFSVAQHYGIPTKYIDFSTDYRVAAYFATNSKKNKPNQNCAIICLNETDFNDFIKFTDILYKEYDVLPPYIVKIDIENLWRLQCQKGCFIFTPFDNVEALYNFDRIIFPFQEVFKDLTHDDIYPKNKSELEILLDQFFDGEETIKRQTKFYDFINKNGIEIKQIPPVDMSKYININSVHKSWKNIKTKNWNYTLADAWNQEKIELSLRFATKDTIENCIKNFQRTFKANKKIKRSTLLRFTTDHTNKKIAARISINCECIWNGTRGLPYTDNEILEIISSYISSELNLKKQKAASDLDQSNSILLEFSNEYGNVARSYALRENIEACFRDDIKTTLKNKLIADYGADILRFINDPRLIFDFKKLKDLFITDIIVGQITYDLKDKKPLIFFSPAQLDILGYA